MNEEKFVQMRRLRRSPAIRAMVAETSLAPEHLILPMFVTAGPPWRTPLETLPGVDLLAGEAISEEIDAANAVGLKSVLLFGVLDSRHKDPSGSAAADPDNPVCQAIGQIKRHSTGMAVIADLCLCEYTSHGHCGLVHDGRIDNAGTLAMLARAAVNLAQAGVDVIAPSGVMDGTVRTLRRALDAGGFSDVALMPYSAKFASGFYGPFKAASRSSPEESLHATHQIQVGNGREALRKIWIDVEEGADMVIVKPAQTSLDILALARERGCPVPMAGYDVSGFYRPLIDSHGLASPACDALMLEILTTIRRAGAQMIITYYAKEAARRLS